MSTPEEIRSAVNAMFRTRAVESPRNAAGLRTVWHRVPPFTELVSELDDTGRVARHQFCLFDDMVVWERGKGFQTGPTEQGVQEVDPEPERIVRLRSVFQSYAGRDRIIHHLRELLMATQTGEQPLADLGMVTGEHPVIREPMQTFVSKKPQPRSERWLLPLGGGLVLLLLALLALLLYR